MLSVAWRFGHVTVVSDTDFQIVFDIAVDDIEKANDACFNEASCDFEDEFCGYHNTKEGDDFDWYRAKGRIYYSTGQSVDHTTNTVEGYYA
ncbi:MAM and LDL-receptor class A domain-containing 1-like [Brachionus plicatilis]|uniref:MAM and LDL-receptor class A domain-containing 1-like n=1 Tax=Brachionus plicatilis TaxID=10195 RepID=A0A3M7QPX7_BRAPC|nr:MAM and LDL-receptor class A domain-containing 1-like [Brachionus plicatilis]